MKKSLLVTVANKKYLDQAKQLFASAYFNAGWSGDYMLLTSDIEEKDLSWFSNRGILINKKKLLFENDIGGMNPILSHKFYLFSPEFKNWNVVVYTDCDVIIRGPLESLKKIKKFCAVKDFRDKSIAKHIIGPEMIKERSISVEEYSSMVRELKKKYNLRKVSFNAGFFAFNTGLVEDNSIMDSLIGLTSKYEKITSWGEQVPFNLVFYNWQKLSPIYNFYVCNNKNTLDMKNEKIKSLVIHFIGELKQWKKGSAFYNEWNDNLKRSESIDVNKKVIAKSPDWLTIHSHSMYLHIMPRAKTILSIIDAKIGLMGLFARKVLVRLLKKGVRFIN